MQTECIQWKFILTSLSHFSVSRNVIEQCTIVLHGTWICPTLPYDWNVYILKFQLWWFHHRRACFSVAFGLLYDCAHSASCLFKQWIDSLCKETYLCLPLVSYNCFFKKQHMQCFLTMMFFNDVWKIF